MKKVITVLSVFIIVVLLFVGCKEDETVAKFINTEVEGTYTLSELEQMSEEERKSNLENKHLYYRLMEDLGYVEDAKRQISLTPAMNLQTVVENLSFKMILK